MFIQKERKSKYEIYVTTLLKLSNSNQLSFAQTDLYIHILKERPRKMKAKETG